MEQICSFVSAQGAFDTYCCNHDECNGAGKLDGRSVLGKSVGLALLCTMTVKAMLSGLHWWAGFTIQIHTHHDHNKSTHSESPSKTDYHFKMYTYINSHWETNYNWHYTAALIICKFNQFIMLSKHSQFSHSLDLSLDLMQLFTKVVDIATTTYYN